MSLENVQVLAGLAFWKPLETKDQGKPRNRNKGIDSACL